MKVIVLLLLLPQVILAQSEKIGSLDSTFAGIQFVQGLSWSQILAKAKEENKYVFADCYATWCAPCRLMKREVFTKKQVGDFMNSHFISVQVQVDSSKTDNEYVKSWYSDANKITEQYNVTSFPTYLYFTPQGEIVHRYLGAVPDTGFIQISANAVNPEKQYYPLLENYLKGKRDYTKMSYLANISRNIKNDSMAIIIATEYLHNYLDNLKEAELYQKKYLNFVVDFLSILSSKDRIFNLFYTKGDNVDKLINRKGLSKMIVEYIITKEDVKSMLGVQNEIPSGNPDWCKIATVIQKKYNKQYADLIVLDAQLRWYDQKNDFPQLIKYTIKKYEAYGLDTAGIGWALINNVAWDLFFKHCNNRDTLNKIILWMEIINRQHPDSYIDLDTYANLLYKAGRREEAIAWEEKVVKMDNEAARKEKRKQNHEFEETLDKMRNGIPTWLEN